MEDKVIKLVGPISWVWGTKDDVRDLSVKRVLYRNENEFVLDFVASGKRYDGCLRRTNGPRFEGLVTVKQGSQLTKAIASCTLYSNEEGFLLFGKWIENGFDSIWWVQLSKVDRFEDETCEHPGSEDSER